jgi:hypothetical protein
MAKYSKTVPKNQANADETLKAALEAIIFFTHDGDEFIGYDNQPDKVFLTFDAAD